MSDWTEKRFQQGARYDAAVDDFTAAKEVYALAKYALRLVQIRVCAEVYGDGSQWHGVDDPRITAQVIEHPEVIAAMAAVNAAGAQLAHADAELAKAQPKHFYGD